MKLKIFRHKEKKWSSICSVLFCLVLTFLAGCTSIPPMQLAPELCSIGSGNGINYSQTINIEANIGDITQSNSSQTFHHAIANPITTEYSYPMEVTRQWPSLGTSVTEIQLVDVDASGVWGAASAYNRINAVESAIENCETAGVSYVHSELRSSGFLLPPSVLLECRLTEVSACAVNPVTVESEFLLLSQQDETSIGNEQYDPLSGRDEIFIGNEQYIPSEQEIADIKAYQEAYELFEEAERAIADDDIGIAMLNLDEAISMVPNEARFSGLKADILLSQQRYREAITTYNEAIDKDDNYFDYYLGRGVAYARSGDQVLAQNDLERSVDLLATATAMNELGKISLSNNELNLAKQYFQAAAGGVGQVASEAALAFARLDIVDTPANYIEIQTYIDDFGRVLASFKNTSSVPLRSVQLEFLISAGYRPGQVSKALVSGEIENLGTDNTIIINVSYLDFPVFLGSRARVSLSNLQIKVLSVGFE